MMRCRRRFVSTYREGDTLQDIKVGALVGFFEEHGAEVPPTAAGVEDAANQGREKACCGREHARYLQLPGPSNQRRGQFST